MRLKYRVEIFHTLEYWLNYGRQYNLKWLEDLTHSKITLRVSDFPMQHPIFSFRKNISFSAT